MKRRFGYTILELMITLSIVAVLVGFGISAYASARDRQVGQSAAETILDLLKNDQQDAIVGKKDCNDTFLGIEVKTTANTSTMTSQSLCQGNVGTKTTTTITGITFTNSLDITFLPLSGGIDLGGGTLSTVNFTSAIALKYAISVNSTGVMRYLGIQP